MERAQELINRTYDYRLEIIKILGKYANKNATNENVCLVLNNIIDDVLKVGDTIFNDGFWMA